MHHPGLGIVGDDRFSGLMWRVLHSRLDADLESLVYPFQNALARHLHGARDLAHVFTSIIAPQDLSSLDIAESGGLGLAKKIEMVLLFTGKNEPRTCGCSRHAL
jgi:hypothetical protein